MDAFLEAVALPSSIILWSIVFIFVLNGIAAILKLVIKGFKL